VKLSWESRPSRARLTASGNVWRVESTNRIAGAFAGLDRAVGVTFFPVFEEIFVEVAAFEVVGDNAGTWYERCFRDGFFAMEAQIRRHKVGKSLLEFVIAMICALHAEL